MRRLPSPVISIGNITAGGTGKTPAVIALAKLLHGHSEWGQISNLSPQSSQEHIRRIAILTRGYKRRSQSPILFVSDGSKIIASPQEAGDEPYLIASALNRTPVVVGADRYSAGRYAIDFFHTQLFILDDGYQHIKLHRDINILLVDATNPFGNGQLLPGGILREPLSEISRADCIIINRANEGDKEYVEGIARSYNRDSPIFYASYKITDVIDLNGHTLGLDHIAEKRLLLFSGIGNPRSFRKTVENAGGRINGEMIFPDHHWYTEKDVERILTEASKLAAEAILTTEKDAVRISGNNLLKSMGIDVLVLKIEMDIGKELGKWILEQIGRQAWGK